MIDINASTTESRRQTETNIKPHHFEQFSNDIKY